MKSGCIESSVTLKCVCRSRIVLISNLNSTFAKIKKRLFLVNLLGCEKGS